MGINVTQLSNLSGSNSNTTWTPAQGIRQSIYDTTNPKFPRVITLDNNFLVIQRGPPSAVTPVAYPVTALLALAVSTNGNLTWPPTFTTSPVNTSVNFSGSTTFTVVANSELSVTYQWKFSTNGGASYNNVPASAPYSGTTTATLSISNVNGLSGNLYQCVATNAQGSTTSQSGKLTVVDPAITAQPSSVSGAHPFNTSFSVTAVGTSTLEYKWYKSTDNGATWAAMTDTGIYSGTATATLTITGAGTANNNEQYFCLVANNTNTSQPANPVPNSGGSLTTPTAQYVTSRAAVITVT